MAKYAAFLRAINVTGRRATKDRLVAAFEACGFEGVSTFRASGNVLFEAPGRAKPKQAEMENALEAELGFEVSAYVRSAAQLAKIADLSPFTANQVKASKGKLQVAFLPRKPTQAQAKEALALELETDPLAIEGTELLWLPASGTQASDLDLRKLERAVGPWTMRTMGTVEQIAEKLLAQGARERSL
jgi:uncharacterized protein (DUF1697 family)